MKKLFHWVSAVAVAGLAAACDGGQSSSPFSPTAPSASNPNRGGASNPNRGGGSVPLASGLQGGSDSCTPPPGADTHYRPAPSGTAPGGSGEPGCQTGTGSGPGFDVGGTPPETSGIPDIERRSAPGR
jgi:hypothetical protein